jgi:serine/threonine protein kinase
MTAEVFRGTDIQSFVSNENGKIATMKSRSSTFLPASEVVETYKTETNRSQCNEEALFNCCEMVLGKLLGTGAFCDVHDLYDVHLLTLKQLDQRKSLINEELEQRKREHIHKTCHDRFGNSRYVVKHLRPNLTEDRGIKIFTHAAVDCLREFDILSRLSHPNIVRLWGSAILSERKVTNGSNKDYKKIVQENNPDMFFIVLEKVEETLSQRILRWILTKKPIRTKCDKDNSDSVMPLPPFYVEKLRYARDIASALAHTHSRGMVFR